MSIFVDERTKVVVQGITGNQGQFHTRQMLDYGTRIVAGVSPDKEGSEVEGIPVYDTVESAVDKHGANTALLFVPAPFVKDAAFEAIDAGVDLVILIAEHVPLQDAMAVTAFAEEHGTRVIGPNTFGICSPGKAKLGIPPNQIFDQGRIGVVSRSGTLSYEIVAGLSQNNLGQTTVVGMGGDRVVGVSFTDVLRAFEQDDDTEAVVLVGEIGGTAEEEAAEFIKGMNKPVIAYLAGKNSPPGKRMGHAGAIVQRGQGSFDSKVKALESAGARVAELPWHVSALLDEVLSE